MSLKNLLRPFGVALSILLVVWIAMRFVESGALGLLARSSIAPLQLVAIVLAAAFAYALAMSLPALAWWRLVATLSPQRPAALQTMATYAVSQYGKYLPGNLAHYALRHVWSRRHGIPHESLGLAAILEAVLFLLAAFVLTVIAGARGNAMLSTIDPRVAIALLLLGLVAITATLSWLRHRGIARLHVPHLSTRTLVVCCACYCGFFVACALLLNGVADALGIGVPSYAQLLGATAASWLAGFLVVGAPAGLGVREAVFVALIGASLGESQALLLIGLYRLITFFGDTLFLAVGALFVRADAGRSGKSVA